MVKTPQAAQAAQGTPQVLVLGPPDRVGRTCCYHAFCFLLRHYIIAAIYIVVVNIDMTVTMTPHNVLIIANNLALGTLPYKLYHQGEKYRFEILTPV